MSERSSGIPLIAGDWGQRNESRLLVPAEGSRAYQATVAVGCFLLAGVFWLAGGLPGVGVAAVTAGIWYAFGIPFAVATGALLASAVGVESLPSVALLGIALFAVVLVPVTVAPSPGRYVLVSTLVTAGLGVTTGLLAAIASLGAAATALLASLAFGMYALHRYQLLTAGILDEDETGVTAKDSTVPASNDTADDATRDEKTTDERS